MSEKDKYSEFSLLDRLIDENPDQADDPPMGASERLRRLRENMRRDIEDLLNAHRTPKSVEKLYPELGSSLLCLGTTGFHGLMLVTQPQQQRLAHSVQTLIETFEPRLSASRVSLGRAREEKMRSLGLKIEAEYRTPEGDEIMTFETSLDPTHRHFSLSGKRNG